jgi:hypothetical protein
MDLHALAAFAARDASAGGAGIADPGMSWISNILRVTFGGAPGAGVGVDPFPRLRGAGGRRDFRVDVAGGAGVLDGRRDPADARVWASAVQRRNDPAGKTALGDRTVRNNDSGTGTGGAADAQ